MTFLQQPQHSRYDLNFTLFGIPIRVHPLFWLMAFIFGASAGDLLFLMVWVFVVFISILFHELGHGLAMQFFRQPANIVLYLGGGLTIPDSVRWGTGWSDDTLERRQQILITLAGPFAGFAIAAVVMFAVTAAGGSTELNFFLGFIPIPLAVLPSAGRLINIFISTMLWVNVFWGIINLMPVFPLDGGQIARHVLLEIDPVDGMRKSLWLSVITGALVAIVGWLLLNSLFMGLMFGMLAYQSYQSLQSYLYG